MKPDAKAEAAVMAVLEEFLGAYANRDLDAMLALFAPGVVFFGTGADEKRLDLSEVKAQLERDWSQSESASLEFSWTSISAAGPVAWVAAEALVRWTAGGQEISSRLHRLTAVLERREERWFIVHWHLSAPDLALAEGESFPTSIDAVASAVQSKRPDLRRQTAPDGTVTLLFTDIENSTALNEHLGDLRWLDLLRAHNALLREQVQAHQGYEVKTVGDGFMIAFSSARCAVQCAMAIQRGFTQHRGWIEKPIRVRVGLHTGEPIKEADDFFGKHVVLAARIADQALGGEILVSSLVKELTESAGDIEFGGGREVELKGLSGTHPMYEVRWQET